jgi:hypothetical protein
MNLRPVTWRGPALSTSSASAARCYRNGIVALVAGAAHAQDLLTEASTIDPRFHLAQVGLAVALAVAHRAFVIPAAPDGITRGERQHTEIVATAFDGQDRRAADLRREHLVEYPGDLLIVWLAAIPSIRCTTPRPVGGHQP